MVQLIVAEVMEMTIPCIVDAVSHLFMEPFVGSKDHLSRTYQRLVQLNENLFALNRLTDCVHSI